MVVLQLGYIQGYPGRQNQGEIIADVMPFSGLSFGCSAKLRKEDEGQGDCRSLVG